MEQEYHLKDKYIKCVGNMPGEVETLVSIGNEEADIHELVVYNYMSKQIVRKIVN